MRGTMPGTMPGMTPGPTPTPTPASRPRRATIKTAKMALLANETAEEAAKAAEAANTTKMPIVALPQVPKNATVDLSAPIVEHLRSQGQQCTVASMDNVCFADLGDVSCDKEDLPMLYCHQSCCEHIVKVVDVRVSTTASAHHDNTGICAFSRRSTICQSRACISWVSAFSAGSGS